MAHIFIYLFYKSFHFKKMTRSNEYSILKLYMLESTTLYNSMILSILHIRAHSRIVSKSLYTIDSIITTIMYSKKYDKTNMC